MLFLDPIRTISVELPSGWAYSPLDSTLTDFFYSRWDHPEQVIAIHVRPPSVPQDEPQEHWVRRIADEIGDRVPLTDISATDGPAVSADFTSAGAAQRVAFVRGRRIELVIEQRGVEPGSRNPWLPVEMAVRTASSTLNQAPPERSEVEEFNQAVDAANRAFERSEITAVVDALEQAIKSGTSAWLWSLVPPVCSPELHAAVSVAQAMMHLGGFTGRPSLLRNAESVLLRAQRTLEQMEPASEAARKLKDEVAKALQDLSSEKKEEPRDDGEASSPVLRLRARGLHLAEEAEKSFDAQDFERAYGLSGMAVEDFLSLICYLRRDHAEKVPEEIAEHLAGQGITDPADQREAMKRARESLLYPPLNASLQIRCSCALELKRPGASEAADMLVQVAKLIAEADPADPGTALNRALARMDSAVVLMMIGDDEDLDEAGRWIGSAEQIIESMEDKRPSSDTWTRCHARQLEGILRQIDRRLAEPEKEIDPASNIKMRSLRSRVEVISRLFHEKLLPAARP